ncbi:MAG: hypothetical protein A07HN63_02444, partial [uncultured archaeon A07HN63]
MNRRAILTTLTIGITGVAGCAGGEEDGGFDGNEEAQTDEDKKETTLSETQQSFRDQLDEDLTVRSTSLSTDEIVIKAQTSGDIAEDMRLAAQVYVNFYTQLDRDLRVRIEDRGLTEATFVIKRRWAKARASKQIDD